MNIVNNKNWFVMNNISECITNFIHVKQLLEKSGGNQKLVDAITVILGHYIEDLDEKFNDAWMEVVNKSNSDRENYTDEELDLMCLSAERDEWKKRFDMIDKQYKDLEQLYLKCVNDALHQARKLDELSFKTNA